MRAWTMWVKGSPRMKRSVANKVLSEFAAALGIWDDGTPDPTGQGWLTYADGEGKASLVDLRMCIELCCYPLS